MVGMEGKDLIRRDANFFFSEFLWNKYLDVAGSVRCV